MDNSSKDEIKCPACGNLIPADSKFCNYCGSKIEHKIIAVPPEPETPNDNDDEADNDYYNNDEEAEAQEKAAQMRKWAITGALVLIVLILTGIILYSNGIIGNSSNNGADSIASITEMSGDDALNTFINTLNQENKNGDGAIAAYAAFSNKDGHERIVGMTYLSSSSQRSVVKIYTIEYNDSSWHCAGEASRFADGMITVDRNELKFDETEVPQIVEIDGKQYFYFVYLVSPASSFSNTTNGGNYHLMFNLFNIESNDIVSADFACTEYMLDGSRYFRGTAANQQQSPEYTFLQGKIEEAKIIYRPTAEELALESPEKAAEKWRLDNSDNMANLAASNDAQLQFTYYDKPLFSKDDVVAESRIGNDKYVFISSPKGIVYGFDRTAHKYFVVYSSASGETPKIELTADGKLHVTVAVASFVVNPATGKASPAAPQHAAEHDTEAEPEASIEG